MALSANASKALEQVKMGLLKLYGADYFTEEEWIKVDGLIHKGAYTFTNGPPKNHYEQELMSFDDAPLDIKPVNMPIHAQYTFESPKKDTMVISEQRVSSPSSSEGADSLSRTGETPNATSIEPSSDDEVTAPVATVAEPAPMFDFSAAAPTSEPCEKPIQTPATGNGLPPGITQAQLDEARSMQAGMTKAGKKGRPKYEKYEETISESAWTETFPAEPNAMPAWNDYLPAEPEPALPSPAPTENHTRISSWASEVNAQAPVPMPSPQPEIVSPTPTKQEADLAPLAEKFVEMHGRKPKTLNDIYQPNNPAHFSNRTASVTSRSTTKTTNTVKTAKATATSAIKEGFVYRAQRSQFKTSHIVIDIKAGDHIKVVKFVSGTRWLGLNMRTKSNGQFSEEVFKPEATQQKSTTTAAADPTPSPVNHRGIETVEDLNASEWNEVPVKKTWPKAVAPSNAPVGPAVRGGLASSRFSILADKVEPKVQQQQAPASQHLTPVQIQEFGKLVDEKVDEILKARGMASTPAPSAAPSRAPPSRSRNFKETLKPVVPKTNTCWFWATGKGCRFTDEQCRDSHEHLDNGPPTNLHMGRPTWGALADSTPSVGHTDPATIGLPLRADADLDSSVDEPTSPIVKKNHGLMTCWYWARDGNCNYTAEDCKYAHELTPKGVAPRPRAAMASWGNHIWKKREDGGETASGWGNVGDNETDAGGESSGELVLEEVYGDDSVSVAGWGVVSDGVDNWGRYTPGVESPYKPPHVKALEEKAKFDAVDW